MSRARLYRSRAVAIAVTILLCQFLPRSLVAQNILAGVTADVARETQSTSLPVFLGPSTDCGVFETGWDILPTFGGQITFASNSESRLGLTGRLTLSPTSGRLTAPAPEAYIFSVDTESDTDGIAEADHEYRLETKAINLRLDLLLDYAVTEKLRLHFGPSFGYVLGIAFTRSDYITDTSYRFSGGQREQSISGQGTLTTQKLIIGGRAGVSYKIPIGDNFVFVPELLLRTEFTPFFQQARRFAFGPGIGFSLLTRISGGMNARDTIVDDIPPPDTATLPPLQASIALHGTDELGRSLPWAYIRIFETLRRTRSIGAWQTERRSSPPTLLVEPDFTSANGIREWRVLFRYEGNVIGTSSSHDVEPPTSIDWKIVDDRDSDTGHPLVVELTVVDSAGATVISTDQIPLKIERLRRIVDDRGDSIIYTLYPAADDSDESVNENDRVLREVIAEAREGGSIKVITLIRRTDGEPAFDGGERGTEAAGIAGRLTRLLEEAGGKTIPVTTGVSTVDSPVYAGLPKGPATIPEIEIILLRPR